MKGRDTLIVELQRDVEYDGVVLKAFTEYIVLDEMDLYKDLIRARPTPIKHILDSTEVLIPTNAVLITMTGYDPSRPYCTGGEGVGLVKVKGRHYPWP